MERQTTYSRGQMMERLAGLLAEVSCISSEQITEDACIDGALRLHSLAFVELQVAIEEAFDVELDPIHIVELNRFGAIVDYVHECTTRGPV